MVLCFYIRGSLNAKEKTRLPDAGVRVKKMKKKSYIECLILILSVGYAVK
jgi:hypothetical protein